MEQNNIVLFQSQDGQTRLEVKQTGESVWLRQEQIAELFGKDVSGVSRHIAKIFKDGELDEKSNLQKMQIAFSNKPVNYIIFRITLQNNLCKVMRKSFNLEVFPYGKFKLLNEDLFEGVEVVLFVENKHCLFVVNRID